MMSGSECPAGAPDRGAVPCDDLGKLPTSKDTLLSIGNVSKMFNVSRFTLLSYERLGLIKRRHRVGNRLVYGWIDCDRLAFIIKARRVGFTVRQVAPMIKAAEAAAPLESVKDARTKCLDLIDKLDGRRRALRDALAELQHFYKLLSKKLPDDDRVTFDGLDKSDQV
jgi:MerR family Zn(II)-responsive transcriptional regulator of zntA